MLTEEIVPCDQIEVLASGHIQVREAKVILRDGVRDKSFLPQFHRYVLSPGDDLSGRNERIVAIATAVWTKDVINNYRKLVASRDK